MIKSKKKMLLNLNNVDPQPDPSDYNSGRENLSEDDAEQDLCSHDNIGSIRSILPL